MLGELNLRLGGHRFVLWLLQLHVMTVASYLYIVFHYRAV